MRRSFTPALACFLTFVFLLLLLRSAIALPGVQISPRYGLQTHADPESGFNQIFYRHFHPQFNYPLRRLTTSPFDKASPRWVSDPGLEWVDENGEPANCQGSHVFSYTAYQFPVKQTLYACVFDRDSRQPVVIADLTPEALAVPEEEIFLEDESDGESVEAEPTPEELPEPEEIVETIPTEDAPVLNEDEIEETPIQNENCPDCGTCPEKISCPCSGNVSDTKVTLENNVNIINVEMDPIVTISDPGEDLPTTSSLSAPSETPVLEAAAGAYYLEGSGCSLLRKKELWQVEKHESSVLWISFILFILLSCGRYRAAH